MRFPDRIFVCAGRAGFLFILQGTVSRMFLCTPALPVSVCLIHPFHTADNSVKSCHKHLLRRCTKQPLLCSGRTAYASGRKYRSLWNVYAWTYIKMLSPATWFQLWLSHFCKAYATSPRKFSCIRCNADSPTDAPTNLLHGIQVFLILSPVWRLDLHPVFMQCRG